MGTASVAFSSLQVVSLLVNFKVQMPSFLTSFLRIFSFFALNLEITQPECRSPFFRKFENRAILMMVLPEIGLAFLIFMFVLTVGFKLLRVRWLEHRKLRAEKQRTGMVWALRQSAERTATKIRIRQSLKQRIRPRQRTRFGTILLARSVQRHVVDKQQHTYQEVAHLQLTKSFFVNTYMSLLSAMFLTVSLQTLTVFDCSWNAETSQYRLKSEPSIHCYDPSLSTPWGKMFAAAVFTFVTFVMGVPILFYYILHRNRRFLHDPAVRLRYGFLYSRFGRGAFMWELCILSRKFAFLAVQLFASNHPSVAITLCQWVVMVAIALQFYWQPFATNQLNKLENIQLICLFLILSLQHLFLDNTLSQSAKSVIGVAIVCLVILMNIVLFRTTLAEARRRIQELEDSCLRRRMGLARRQEKLKVSVLEKANQFLDTGNLTNFRSWIDHSATYTELGKWDRFFQELSEFEQFEMGAQGSQVPLVCSKMLVPFFEWFSKASPQSVTNAAAAFCHVRLFKRIQRSNEIQVLTYVVNTLKSLVQSRVTICECSITSPKWNVLRHEVLSGRWRLRKWSMQRRTASTIQTLEPATSLTAVRLAPHSRVVFEEGL
eukprot:c20608_g1_i4.p2 GENE.c20608_g1_i4~~c20608_g1_i4.p2  ORF type:complete len:694 (+),score=111.38 c20608_g1_i4:275-2083(+)